MAARTVASVAATAAALYLVKVPTRTRNSLTKVDRPGSDRAASPDIRNSPASTGATDCTPPESLIMCDRRRSIMKPASRNGAPADNAWLTMYTGAPDGPWPREPKSTRPVLPSQQTELKYD